MGAECLCFWLCCWIGLELARVRFLMTQLSLVLMLILSTVALLLLFELDLLGTFILAVYSSVFIALALLALHFGPFWASAQLRGRSGAQRYQGLLALALGLGGLAAYAGFGSAVGVAAPSLLPLFHDLSAEQAGSLVGASGTLHWLFYRLMALETAGLNVYLFLGLLGTLTFVWLRASWLDAAAVASKLSASNRQPAHLADVGMRVRIAARFRRQVRRTNTSQLRFK